MLLKEAKIGDRFKVNISSYGSLGWGAPNYPANDCVKEEQNNYAVCFGQGSNSYGMTMVAWPKEPKTIHAHYKNHLIITEEARKQYKIPKKYKYGITLVPEVNIEMAPPTKEKTTVSPAFLLACIGAGAGLNHWVRSGQFTEKEMENASS